MSRNENIGEELRGRYAASVQSIQKALHVALLEIDEAVMSNKHYIGTAWYLVGTSQEKVATCIDTNLQTQNTMIIEPVPNGRMKLLTLLENDELLIKVRRIPGFALYGLTGLLRLVDIYRLKLIFALCRKLLRSSCNLQMHYGEDTSIGGVIQIITSVFGDAILHREINSHPSTLHIFRVFVATATQAAYTDEKMYNDVLLEALVTAIAVEIFSLKSAGSVASNCDSVFGVSLSAGSSMSADTSFPFLHLDRFLSLDDIKSFVSRVFFSHAARSTDETELVLNCYIINDFESTEEELSDLPYVFPAHIHYSWALVKPSTSDDVMTTVLHGGEPPLALLFGSVFDNLSGLQAYVRLFDSTQSVNSFHTPNSVLMLRQYYQHRLIKLASDKSLDNLYDLSLSVLAYCSTIGPPVFGREIDSHVQRHLIESAATLFSSTASALRALINYGLALGVCGTRFVGVNDDSSQENGRWYSVVCQNFAKRTSAFFGMDNIHCRSFPTPDSVALANLLVTTADILLPPEKDLPISMTALPNIITAITMYALMYWGTISTVTIMSNCHMLLTVICNLRHQKFTDTMAELLSSKRLPPLTTQGVVKRFMQYLPDKNKNCLLREPAASYLRAQMRRKFHVDFVEMVYEVLSTAFPSTPKSHNPQQPANNNTWLSSGARLAKLASVRSFVSSYSPIKAKHFEFSLGCHPAVHSHLSHCNGCILFASRIFTVMAFLNPPLERLPSCFRPLLAISGPGALRCSYTGVMSTEIQEIQPCIFISQFWLPTAETVDLVAAPLDAIADTMTNYLSTLCVHGTAVQLLCFRFVVLNSLSTTDEEDLSCYQIPPIDVALPVAFRDITGCSSELRRWWSISPRHRVLLRGIVNIAEPPPPPTFLSKPSGHPPNFIEFLVDIRPCFTAEFVCAFRPFDRLCHIFPKIEDYGHFETSFVRLSGINDSSVIGFGADDAENAISIASFFNFPLIPFAQRQLDLDIHSRYSVAMATSNWFEAAQLAHWHAILILLSKEECNCALLNTEATFKRSINLVPLLRLPSWLKGLQCLVLYCRDSLLTALNFSTGTSTEVSSPSTVAALFANSNSPIQIKVPRAPQTNLPSNFCKFEVDMLKYLRQLIAMANGVSGKRNAEQEAFFRCEPTGYGSVVWAVASDCISDAIKYTEPFETFETDRLIQWQEIVDKFNSAAHALSRLAALLLGYCDSMSYYHLFAFGKNNQLVRRVSFSCVSPSLTETACPPLPKGMFRQDIMALTRTPVIE